MTAPLSLTYIITRNKQVFNRRAWTGGDVPPENERRYNPVFRELVRAFFRESLTECGGLDLWKCAGTSSMERARIFWNQARLDAWRTFTEQPHTEKRRPVYPFTVFICPTRTLYPCAEYHAEQARGLIGFHNTEKCPRCRHEKRHYEFWGENHHLQGYSQDYPTPEYQRNYDSILHHTAFMTVWKPGPAYTYLA